MIHLQQKRPDVETVTFIDVMRLIGIISRKHLIKSQVMCQVGDKCKNNVYFTNDVLQLTHLTDMDKAYSNGWLKSSNF